MRSGASPGRARPGVGTGLPFPASSPTERPALAPLPAACPKGAAREAPSRPGRRAALAFPAVLALLVQLLLRPGGVSAGAVDATAALDSRGDGIARPSRAPSVHPAGEALPAGGSVPGGSPAPPRGGPRRQLTTGEDRITLKEDKAEPNALVGVGEFYKSADEAEKAYATYELLSITPDQQPPPFEVMKCGGEIRVGGQGGVDYETQTEYELTIEGTHDELGEETRKITITIQDVDEPPIAVDAQGAAAVSLLENKVRNHEVYTVSASFEDGVPPNNVFEYTFDANADGGGCFALDKHTGKITVADDDRLDFEKASS